MLKTKLHRPPLTAEHVFRLRLIDELNKNIYKPFSLVCAPAGYGKSMLASSWTEKSKHPTAWLSLSDDENDLRTFIIYLIASIQKVFSEKMENTKLLVNAPDLPTKRILTHSLINELDQIQENLIIVLDDYHLIHDESIHQLIDELLHYPPENLHLCMLTRRDPPLKIKNLRAHNRMNEIRMDELTFNEDEIIGLFNFWHGIKLEKSIAASLQKRTEGWITALQLISMASKNKLNIEAELASFKGDLHTLNDFLIEEILTGLSDELKELLFSTALLDRFCIKLVKTCCMVIEKDTSGQSKTDKLFEQLVKSNLFLIPLDDEQKWFRYHHLFQKILVNHLGPRFDIEKIKTIHHLAAKWFEEEGLIDEAIDQFKSAGDMISAAEIVEKNAHNEFLYSVFQVEEWLKRIPLKLREQRPELLLIDAWIAYRQLHLERVPALLNKINSIAKNPDQQLLAEINFFNGNFMYWMGGGEEAEMCANMLQQALIHAENMPVHVLSNIELLLNMALQKKGEKETLLQVLENRVLTMDNLNGYRLAFTYGSLTFVNLLCGNLMKAKKTSSQMQIFTAKIGADYLHSWSIYIHALASFHLFEMDEAENQFKLVIERYYNLDRRVVVDSMAAQALLCQFKGENKLATLFINKLMQFAHETNDLQILFVANSAQMRLALLQGNFEPTFQWAEAFTEQPIFLGLFFWQEVPWFTLAKVLIAKGTPESLEKAIGLIKELSELITSSNLDYHLVETNMLLALALEKSGQSHKSIEYFKLSVLLANEIDCFRPFIEAEKSVHTLLEILQGEGIALDFIDKITNFRNEFAMGHGIAKVERPNHSFTDSQTYSEVHVNVSFTEREQETLHLLAQGLRNKEIANKLFVSEGTIKKHVYNMCQKLSAGSRVDLINKAKDSGLLK